MPRRISLVVIGSSNTDLVLECDRLPKPGETLAGGQFMRFAGGKGANQAVAAARAGAHVSFIGIRGNDDFGVAAEEGLRREKIDTRFFQIRRGVASGVALILIGGRDRQNMIGVARSANDTLSAADVSKARAAFQQADAVIAQLEVPMEAIARGAEMARQLKIPFVLNPAPARKLPRALLEQVHVLTPNVHEVCLLAGEDNPRKAARRLLKWGCRQVVVTHGARGAWVAGPEGETTLPAPKVSPVDTVGAGDCFSAWLAVGLAEGRSLLDASRRAIKAASISVTRHGAQTAMPQRAEVTSA